MANSTIVSKLNKVLNSVGIEEKFIEYKNISIPPNSKAIIVSSSSPMHKVLENYMYPPIEELVVYHYTDEEVAQNIKSQGVFRLYNILKRYGEGEIAPFLNKFGFEEAFDGNGQLKAISQYENIFYGSFIEAPLDDIETEEMKNFTDLCETRLKFHIKSSKGFFRKIKYEFDASYNLFNKFKKIAEEHDRKFLIEGMSGRFASFCISDEYKIENEYRAYWRHWSEEDGFVVKDDENQNKYIEIRLEKENFSGITISLLDD